MPVWVCSDGVLDAPWTGLGVPSSRLAVAVAYVRGTRGSAPPRTHTCMCQPPWLHLGCAGCALSRLEGSAIRVCGAREWHPTPYGSYVGIRATYEECLGSVMSCD